MTAILWDLVVHLCALSASEDHYSRMFNPSMQTSACGECSILPWFAFFFFYIIPKQFVLVSELMTVTITCCPVFIVKLIELGRYALPTPLPVEERTCWYCTNQVEDESHFLITCKLYDNSNARAVPFDRCSTLNPAFSDMTDADKMKSTKVQTLCTI